MPYATLEHLPDFFRALVQGLPDLVWIKDPQGVYLACNPRFEALYGKSEAEIVGKTDRDFVSAELAAFSGGTIWRPSRPGARCRTRRC